MAQGMAIEDGIDRAKVFRMNMRLLLQSRSLSQRQAAENTGVSYKWMRRACHRGLKRTDRRTLPDLQRVAEFFGVEIVDLWNEKFQHRSDNGVLIQLLGDKRRQAGRDQDRTVDVPQDVLDKHMQTEARATDIQYEPVLNLPSLSQQDLEALRDNIAVNGVQVPIVVDSDGVVRRIIDGNHRKRIADEFGYACPEIVQPNLDEDEKRTLARALNLARRHLTQEQKRQLIADQLIESSDRSNRWYAKQLGVHHATVASVRATLESNGEIQACTDRMGRDGKVQPARKNIRPVLRSPDEQEKRLDATTIIQGDCRDELPKFRSNSVDAVITDPIYPEIDREYGRITEAEWHDLMRTVVNECRRILKPSGSAVIILQPNYEHVGQMRLWLWEFLLWAAKEWNLVQDVYSWTQNALPQSGTNREQGLMRHSVKMSIWLGPKDCYRNQDAVLYSPSTRTPLGASEVGLEDTRKDFRSGTIPSAAAERGGSIPFNMLLIANGSSLTSDHPARTSQQLANFWCRYILPQNGVLLDCFAGGGGILSAGLNNGASQVIGIEKEERYCEMAWKRIREE